MTPGAPAATSGAPCATPVAAPGGLASAPARRYTGAADRRWPAYSIADGKP